MLRYLKSNKILIFILFSALILRVGYLLILQPPLIWSDSPMYDTPALNFIKGQGYAMEPGVPSAAKEPGYSLFFLAPVYFIFTHNIFIVQILQIILSLVIIWLIFQIGKNYFPFGVAVITGLFFALYPPLIVYSGEILPEIFFTFLLVLSIYTIIRSVETNSVKKCFLGGLFLGVATLTRSITTFLPLFLIPFFYLYLKDHKKVIKYFLLICLGIAVFSIPYTARNYFVFGEFIYGREDGGVNLWAGSYIPWGGEWRGHSIPPLPELIKGLDYRTAQKELTELAIENIKNNPLGVLKIWLQKPGKMFFKSEFNSVLQRENKFSQFSSQGYFNPLFIKRILLFVNILIVSFAMIGAFFAFYRNKSIATLLLLIIFYFLLILLPFCPDSRYKLPLMPFIMILSGIGFWQFIKGLKMLERFKA